MKIVLHVPFGTYSPESSIIFLLGNYLQSLELHSLSQLRCNGAFSVCDRDAERSWRRGLHSCQGCMRDQSSLGIWANVAREDLSRFISPDEITSTRRAIIGASTEDLELMQLTDIALFDLIRESFRHRFGIPRPDWSNVLHEQAARRLMLGSYRMLLASKRLLNTLMPDLMIVSGGSDSITAPLIAQADRLRRPVATCSWDLNKRSVQIRHPRRAEAMNCELMVQGLAEMRSDARTWSSELLHILNDILDFLEIPRTAEQLQVAQ